MNYGEDATARIAIDGGRLGLGAPGTWQAADAEGGAPVETHADGTISVPVKRHDYRQVVLAAARSPSPSP